MACGLAMTSRHYIHIHRMEWKVLIRCVGGAAVGSGWRWWMNLRKRMPDNRGEGGEGSKCDTRAQASVCCVGMFLPSCSTHVACVGVLWWYRLCKCDCERTRCHRRVDDVHFGTWKPLVTRYAKFGQAICDIADVYISHAFLTHWGRLGSFKLFKRPFPGFLTILTL